MGATWQDLLYSSVRSVEEVRKFLPLSDEEAEQLRLKEWKRKGLLLQDDAVLQAMEPGDEMSRLCCSRVARSPAPSAPMGRCAIKTAWRVAEITKQ